MPTTLAEREKDYFKGLSTAYKVEKVDRRNGPFIVVSLKPDNKRPLNQKDRQLSAKLLRRTMGTEGLLMGVPEMEGFSVSLLFEEFRYILDPLEDNILADKKRFAEYATGVFHGELIPVRRSFSTRDPERAEQIKLLHTQLGAHYGRGRKIGNLRDVAGRVIFDFKNPAGVLGSLKEDADSLIHISAAERVFAEYMNKRLPEIPVGSSALVTAAR